MVSYQINTNCRLVPGVWKLVSSNLWDYKSEHYMNMIWSLKLRSMCPSLKTYFYFSVQKNDFRQNSLT